LNSPPLLRPLAAATLLCGLAAASTQLDISWEGWRQATCMPARCFCEAVRDGATVRQPANTWTNLGFVLVGVFIAADAGRARAPGSPGPGRAWTLGFGASVIFLGLASFFYHASLTFLGQCLDVAGMYLVGSALLAHMTLCAGLCRPQRLWLIFPGAGLGLAGLAAFLPAIRRPIVGALFLLALGLGWVLRRRADSPRKAPLLRAAAGCFVLAFSLWCLDISGRLGSPNTLLQGHAAWHLLCACSLGLAHLHTRRTPSVPG